jgi:hypothetical protein
MMEEQGGPLPSPEAVVAGSPGFVDALLPLVRDRLGGQPQAADSPALASAFCQGGARLLLYEHAGREWLGLCEELRRASGNEIIVVAAVPPENAAEVAAISASASAVVAWNGDPRPVIDAVLRVVAERETAPQPARRTGPVLTPQPQPTLARPPPATPAPQRPAPTPTGAPRPRPVMTPATPRPAVATTPSPSPVPVARPAPSPLPAPAQDVNFEGIFEEEAAVDPATPEPVTARPVEATPAPYAPTSSVWPGTVLSAADGLAVVRAALSGLWPEQPLRPVTEKVVAALSTAEKAAALGQKLPFDAAPVRRAVGLRWQVAAAIDTLPPVGAPIDQASVQAILVGIDEVLAELKVEADDAAPEALRAVEAVRHELVREAIDLTEALQQVAPAELVEEITTSRKARRSDVVPITRMVKPAREIAEPRRQVPWGLVVLLVLTVLGGAAYHGYRFVNRPKPLPPPVAGAPAGTVGSVTPKGKLVLAPPGTSLDPREVENFKNLERAKGNEVREVAPRTFVVTPAAPATQQREQGAKP